MSCADVQTIQAGNGTKTQFSFDFPYIFKSEIHVYFWNATTKEWDEKLTTDATYPWQVTDANPTIVEFTSTAPPAPATPVDPNETSVDNVRIRRETNIEDIRALFSPGSAIRSDDLNNNFEQLRYAIQESNCQGVTDDVYQYLLDNYWDRFDNTLYDGDTWVSDDTKIATSEAIDDRIDSKIDTAITSDIATDGTGITVTDDGDGTITLGLAANTIDFDRIKNSDIITQAEQDGGAGEADSNIFTALAAARRFDTLVQTSTPSGSAWETGKTWYQNDEDKTVYVWDGSGWEAITSGGAFTRLDQVIYVDANNGDDANNGHRVSTPKKTIKSALAAINSDSTYGDGSTILVAPGVYKEVAPLDIQKKDVSIIGASIRNVIVHPTTATETNSLFRVNSGSYLQNMTFTGVKASGTRGEAGSLWEDATYGLPATQGWNVSFYPNAYIYKSPYIQNCTNFSDSEIDNDALDFYAGTEDKGRAGDLDSAMTGGGLLIDGSTVHDDSPLRSIVADSYTHVGLDGPGIFVTNNGYVQVTSSYAFFNHFHIACLNGGQANLAASTTDFGRYSLVADGRSTNAIFTATTAASANDGDITFTIGAPSAGSDWHGSATRPQDNMLVDIGGNTYPVLSATANGSGWDVTISRPNTSDRTQNLGLDGAVSNGSSVSFYLRSMIASSGHTMEYVGSGTNYSALPENGGVPNDNNQVVERNDGKVWTAITDHNGTFKVGETFEVNQQTGFVNIPAGALSVSTLLEDLNVNGKEIKTVTTNQDIVLNPNGTGVVDVSTSRITNVVDPVNAQDAATKNFVDNLTTSTTAELNILDGATLNTSELNTLDGITASTAELNQLDGKTITTTFTGSNTNDIPTSSAVNSYVVNLFNALGGFVAIDNENSFPNSNPDPQDGAGTVVSIADAGGLAINGSGVATGQTLDTTTVTINGFPSHMYNETLAAGLGVQVQTTSTEHTYTFHKLIPKDTDILRLSDDINDFNNRYRVGTSNPTTDNDAGDLFFNTGTGKMLVYDAGDAAWEEVQSIGDFLINTISSSSGTGGGSATFNGTAYRFTLDNAGSNVFQMLVSVNGVIQKPNSGTTQPSEGFALDGADIIFSDPPATGSPFFIVTLGSTVNIGEPSNNTVTADKIVDGSITNAEISSSAAIAGTKISPNFGSQDLTLDGTATVDRIINATTSSDPWLKGVNSSGTETSFIKQSGEAYVTKLGVGTTSPTYLCNVLAASGSQNIFQAGQTGVSNGYTITSNGTNLTHAWFNGGSEAARIDSSGRVGIGTSSPGSQLEVRSTGDTEVRITGNGGNSDNDTNSELSFQNSTHGVTARIRHLTGVGGVQSGKGQLAFFVDNGATLAERLRINEDGLVGIGTTSPAATLDAVAESSLALGLRIRGRSSDSAGIIQFTNNGASAQTAQIQGTGTSNLVFASGSTERVRIDSSGRLLVGTSTAAGSEVLQANGVYPACFVRASTSGGPLINIKRTRGNSPNVYTAVQNGDNLGSIQWNGAYGSAYAVGATIEARADGQTWASGDCPGRLVFATTADGASSPTERMRIDSSGGVFTNGATSAVAGNPSDGIHVGSAGSHLGETALKLGDSVATARWEISTGNYHLNFNQNNGSGTYISRARVTNSTGAYVATSDRRAKKDIADLDYGIDTLKQLRPVSYLMKDQDEAADRRNLGFIAQEVLDLVPEAVTAPDNPDDPESMYGLEASALIPVLVSSLQQAVAKIETLEAKVAALEAN